MCDGELKRYEAALGFATRKHEGQTRIGDLPYITHPVAVAEIIKEKGYDTDYQIAALFHDLLEDTDATDEEILKLGGEKVLEAVRLLTKEKGYVMQEYIDGIKNNPMAYAIKGADRLHNLRCATLTSEKFKQKYIAETVEWYLDFMPEIKDALETLVSSLENPLT